MQAASQASRLCSTGPKSITQPHTASAVHRCLCIPCGSAAHFSLGRKRLRADRVIMHGLLDSYRQQKATEQETSEAGPSDGPEDEGTCSAECVQEVHSAQEFKDVLHRTNSNTLVVLDIFKTSCGACKYLERGFLKMCKKGEEDHAPVVFLKHNIMDEYEEPTDLSEQLSIRAVPMFYFFKAGKEIDHFATREKGKIIDAIEKYVPGVDMHL
ncbi:hypothetical protein WJX74_009714 [Apatococcus lobatus]|uniref:Thioredoxin domain-containing protein n=2 Tax=Apatococcus TaxID=904362 RepID=A0AAW1SVX6_9CHLO